MSTTTPDRPDRDPGNPVYEPEPEPVAPAPAPAPEPQPEPQPEPEPREEEHDGHTVVIPNADQVIDVESTPKPQEDGE